MKIKIFALLIIGSLFLTNCNTDDNSGNDQVEELNFIGEIESFGDFFVSRLLDTENLKTALIVRGTGRENLNLTSEYTAFSLPNNDLTIEISNWDIPVNGYFSNDAPVVHANKLESWNAISGTVKLLVKDIGVNGSETYYKITMLLENIVFENNGGVQKSIPYLVIEDAFVGWLPG